MGPGARWGLGAWLPYVPVVLPSSPSWVGSHPVSEPTWPPPFYFLPGTATTIIYPGWDLGVRTQQGLDLALPETAGPEQV